MRATVNTPPPTPHTHSRAHKTMMHRQYILTSRQVDVHFLEFVNSQKNIHTCKIS